MLLVYEYKQFLFRALNFKNLSQSWKSSIKSLMNIQVFIDILVE